MSTIVADYAYMDCPGDTTQHAGVDPHAAVAAGVGVVILRRSVCYYDAAHNAWALKTDPVYARDAQAWRDAGAIVGSYIFPAFGVGAPSPAEQVAAYHGSAGQVLPGVDLPSCLDVEFPGRGIVDTHMTQHEVGEEVVAFVHELVLADGCAPLVYTSHVQMHDSNGLGGVLAGRVELAACPLWDKVPYPVGAGKPPQLGLARAPHDGAAAWDRSDLWSYPAPWKSAWLVQEQGDVRGFPGIRQCDLGHFVNLSPANPRDPRWDWVATRLKFDGERTTSALAALIEAFQTREGLTADTIIGPKTFCAIAWG